MSVQIRGSGGDLAVVDANGALAVNLPGAAASAGKAVALFEADGGLGGLPVRNLSPEVSYDYRLRAGLDTLLECDTWNASAQNTSKYIYRNTTLAAAWGGGFLTTNSGSATSINSAISVVSWRNFPLFGGAATFAEFQAGLTAAMPTNTTLDFGFGTCATSSPYAATDGAYFRANSSGWFGVVNSNGTEVVTAFATAFTPAINQIYKFAVVVGERAVEFWVDDVMRVRVLCPVTLGQPFMCGGQPIFIRHAIGASAASAVVQLKVADVLVGIEDYQTAKPWAHQMAGMGLMAYQGQNGGTLGTTASYANSADPSAAAALSNTSPLVTGLGGQFRFNAAATATTDGIVTSYQVPPGGVIATPHVLYICGVRISCVNLGAAVATTCTTLAWSLAFGHSAVALAQGEAATTKAPRRIALGIMNWPIGAVVGAQPDRGDIYVPFTCPVVVNPGEFIATVAKFIQGTATASQVIWGHVTFDGYFE